MVVIWGALVGMGAHVVAPNRLAVRGKGQPVAPQGPRPLDCQESRSFLCIARLMIDTPMADFVTRTVLMITEAERDAYIILGLVQVPGLKMDHAGHG
jgi:hypothetical protein